MHFNDDFPKWLLQKSLSSLSRRKEILEANVLASRGIYLIHLYFLWNFDLKIKLHYITYQ